MSLASGRLGTAKGWVSGQAHRMLAFLLAVGLVFASVPFLSRDGVQATASGAPLRVATTTSVLADLVANVGGDAVEVRSVVPFGADAHHYDPTPRDGRFVATADVLFVNGLGLESWLERFLKNIGGNIGGEGMPVVVLSEGIELESEPHSYLDAHGAHSVDPHLWLNPHYAMAYVERIRDTLIDLDPANAERYRAGAEAYLSKLRELDAWIEETLAELPPGRRVLVTYHDAFRYFADRYGLKIVSFLVPDPEREPSAERMGHVVRAVREAGAPAIFAEPHVHPRLAQALAREAGVEVGYLYSDALTEAVPTYVDMMRRNTLEIVEKLR